MTTSPKPRVLVTGANGLVGRTVLQHLRDKEYFVVGCDVNGSPSQRLEGVSGEGVPVVDAVVVLDVADAAGLKATLEEHHVTAVVHCAADPRGDAPSESTMHSNVLGSHVVIRCCRESESVTALVFFSSLMVNWGTWLHDEPYSSIREGRFQDIVLAKSASSSSSPSSMLLDPSHIITHESTVRPTTDYAASKLWAEALARSATEDPAANMSAFCIRLGAVNAEDDAMDPSWGALWCSRRDLATLVERCIITANQTADASQQQQQQQPPAKFGIFYAVSNSPYRWVDVTHAEKLVGWKPQDSPVFKEGKSIR